MAIALYLLISLYCVIAYRNGKYFSFLAGVALICYDGFGLLKLLNNGGFNPMYDSVIVVVLATLFLKEKPKLNEIRDPIAKWIIIILLYRFVITLLTVVRGDESIYGALSEYRYSFVLLLYFVYRKIKPSSIQPFIKYLWKGLLLAFFGFLVYLILVGKGSFDRDDVGNPFFVTCLFLSFPFFFYYFFERKGKKSKHYGLLCFFILLLTLARGIFLATCIVVVVYYIVVKKRVWLLLPLSVLGIGVAVVFTVIDSRKTEAGSISIASEFEEVDNLNGNYENYQRGSLALRVVMVLERVDYMTKDTRTFLFGVGPLKEKTAQRKLRFVTGTRGDVDGEEVRLQIASDDVGLLANFARYGFLEVVLFFTLLITICKQFYRHLDQPYMIMGLLTTLTMMFSIPTSDMFSNPFSLNLFLLLAALILNYTPQQNHITTT